MNKNKILVADDDRLVLTTLSRGLREAGYDVFTASDGSAAVQLGREQVPDLAVLDVRMPGLMGIEAARQLRDEAGVASMFLSAYSDRTLVELATSEGALGYLVKPVTANQLVPAVEAALLRASEIEALRQNTSTLANAITSNREISVAIGIYMERHGVSHGQALESLRHFARSRQRRLLEVARELTAGRNDADGLVAQIAPKRPRRAGSGST